MNKLLLVMGVIFLSGCQQLMHGAIQPVKTLDAKNSLYFTTCAGVVEDWPSCYDKASDTCNKSYIIVSKVDDNRGTRRDLTFQCKK